MQSVLCEPSCLHFELPATASGQAQLVSDRPTVPPQGVETAVLLVLLLSPKADTL